VRDIDHYHTVIQYAFKLNMMGPPSGALALGDTSMVINQVNH